MEEVNPEKQPSGKPSSGPKQSRDQQKLRHIGTPGIESASGRDRSKGELPASFGKDEDSLDLSNVAPPPGSVEGTRVGPEGDPTGSDERDEGSESSAPS